MTELLGKIGTVNRKTAGYSPEQNGAAERLNLTLEQWSKALLADSGLGPEWCAEAMVTANYTRTGCPRGSTGRLLRRCSTMRSPTLATCGYLGHGHTSTCPRATEREMQPVSEQGVFLGV